MSQRYVELDLVRDLLGLWLEGHTLRAIARVTGVDRKTVRRYVRIAQAASLTALTDDSLVEIAFAVRRRTEPASVLRHALSTYREQIRNSLAHGATLSDVHAQLRHHGVKTSYATLRRFAIEACGWRPQKHVRSAA